MDIANTMKRLREERLLSRTELAARLGITTGALWKIEHGKTIPKPRTIEKFCIEMDVPLAYFYDQAKTPSDYRIASE